MAPVVFDATHALQMPGGRSDSADGRRQQAAALARSGMALGIAGLFLEAHPDPEQAKCDGPCALPLSALRDSAYPKNKSTRPTGEIFSSCGYRISYCRKRRVRARPVEPYKPWAASRTVFGDSHTAALLRAQEFPDRGEYYKHIGIVRLRKEKGEKRVGDVDLERFCASIGRLSERDFVFCDRR